MAELDPSIILGGRRAEARPNQLQSALNVAGQVQGLRQNFQNLQQGPFRQQLLEQQVATGEREAQRAAANDFLLGGQAAVNAFERNDINGVVKTIVDLFPDPLEQREELAEFNADPVNYIGQIKDSINAAQGVSGAQRAKFIGTPQRVEQDGQSFLAGIVQNTDGSFSEKRVPISGEFVSPLGETADEQTARKVKEAGDKARSTELGKLDPVASDLAAEKQEKIAFAKSKNKFNDSVSQTVSAIASSRATHGLMSDTVTEIKSFISGLNAVYGASLKDIPGSQAKKLKGLIDTMKANSAFGSLIDLKASGGTLGAISSTELELLAAKLGSLDQKGEIPEQIRVLDQILAQNQGSIDRMEKSFASEKARFDRGFGALEPQQGKSRLDELREKAGF